MGWFSKKDWNVLAIIFERHDMYVVNGNRAKGKDAEKIRDGASKHPRAVYWAVFDQKGSYLDGGPGPAKEKLKPQTFEKLKRDLITIPTVREVLRTLEGGGESRLARQLIWSGYPLPEKTED